MSYSDLIRNLEVNRKFTKITNPVVATYFSVIQEILVQVKKKQTCDVNGFWKLNRKFISDETGIPSADQKVCDQTLVKLGIVAIDPANPDRMAVDTKRYIELLVDDTAIPEEILSKTAKLTPEAKKAAKHNSIISGIVDLFEETDEDLLAVIRDLVETHYKRGLCTHSAWKTNISLINAAAKDAEAKTDLIKYILATNYVSIAAAIDSFMKKHTATGTRINVEQTKCSGTMSGIEF